MKSWVKSENRLGPDFHEHIRKSALHQHPPTALKIHQIPPNRGHKAFNRGTLGGCRQASPLYFELLFPKAAHEKHGPNPIFQAVSRGVCLPFFYILSLGIQAHQHYQLWGRRSVDRIYFGLFGAPGFWGSWGLQGSCLMPCWPGQRTSIEGRLA